MKTKILGLLTMFLFLVSSNLSGFSVSGTLSGPDGEGVSFHLIQIEVAFANSESITLEVETDSLGEFSFDLNSSLAGNSYLLFSFLNCNGERSQERIIPGSNAAFIEVDLKYCERTGNRRCAVRIEYNRTNSGEVYILAHPRGVPPFSFQWSDGSTDRSTIVSPNTPFCVTITDALGCTAKFCSEDEREDVCNLIIHRFPSANNLGTLLEANLRPSGLGTQYSWNTGDTTQSILVDEPGLYCVRVWNDDGCFGSKCIRIGRPNIPEKDCFNARLVLRRDSSNLKQLMVLFDQLIPLDFEWSTGETVNPITVDESGLYSVTVTHPGLDCQVVLRKFVNLNPCNISIATRPTNRGYALTVMGLPEFAPNENYGLMWNTGETTRTIFVPNLHRKYCVTLRSAQCSDRACVRTRAGAANRSVEFHVRPLDRDNLFLVSASISGDEYAEWIWSDGTEGPSRVVENNAVHTAYAFFSDGEMISGDFVLESNEPTDSGVSAFPNPADHSVTLNWSNENNSATIIRVFDPTGKLVQEYKLDGTDRYFGRFTIETGDLYTGLYWINIVSEGFQESVPLLIQRN